MIVRKLNNDDEWLSLYCSLEKDKIDPSTFNRPPTYYPAIACWSEREIDSMRFGWDADGDYIYPDDFELTCSCGNDNFNSTPIQT